MLTVVMIDDDFGDVKQVQREISAQAKHLKAVFGHEMGLWVLKGYTKNEADILPALIVTEAKFVDGSGVEIIRFVTSSSLLQHIPVVVYTNTDDVEAKQACLVAGATKIITKGLGQQGLKALAAYVSGLSRKSRDR
jgi:response regulator RpfG family c-di-GMP phosphodiesterase